MNKVLTVLENCELEAIESNKKKLDSFKYFHIKYNMKLDLSNTSIKKHEGLYYVISKNYRYTKVTASVMAVSEYPLKFSNMSKCDPIKYGRYGYIVYDCNKIDSPECEGLLKINNQILNK